MIIKTHRELAEHIAGKRILHMNSLGKDALVSLYWLANYAQPSKVISVHFKTLAPQPYDDAYLKYQARQFPNVEFLVEPNANDVTNVGLGYYQSPIRVMHDLNKWEYENFSMRQQAEELLKTHACDYICLGHSKYEGVARAIKFYKKGLLHGNSIFPLGLLTKDQVISIIKTSGIKVHPIYKLAKSTLDYPSYWKMRAAMLVNPRYEKDIYSIFPLLRLDKYRYEKLLK